MNNSKKKSAVRAGTPATENRKILSINSILKNAGDVKVLIKEPGELPRMISAYDVPPEFVSRRLHAECINRTLTLVYDPKSLELINLSFGRNVYRGTVVVVNAGFNRLYEMTERDRNKAFIWLMDHKV